ncbi:Pr6Pr family membrane protein [Microbacteriaceae bacterium VKM Ac-2855]|nr:Pr6Pr family membrane protein [Microbacteriaceae bacterium VKM Ac-2855]
MRKAFAILRLALAVLGVIALTGDYFYTLGFRAFQIDNFFAYFTTQSNMAGVLVMALSGLVGLARRWEPRWLSVTRALVIVYIIVSGIVFGLIAAEANTRSYRLDIPWSSAILHFWIPSIAILDWILGPGRRPVPWRTTLFVLIFPVGWGVVTLIRGAIIGWYPYFFLDPGQVDGPVMYALYDVIVLVLFAGIAAFVAALSRVRPLGGHTVRPHGAAARGRMRWRQRGRTRSVVTPPSTSSEVPVVEPADGEAR